MSCLVTARFYSSGVPAIGLTPVIKIIKESDSSVVVVADSMTEVNNGFYKYEFTGYSNTELYFFAIDWGAALDDSDRYLDNLNQLDSYGNKWSRGVSWLFIDNEKIAKAIWDYKLKDSNKEWTFGKKIQTEMSFVEINLSINEVQRSILDMLDNLHKNIRTDMVYEVNKGIASIEFPEYEQITKSDLEDTINPLKEEIISLKEDMEEKEEEKEDESDDKEEKHREMAWIMTNVIDVLTNLYESIDVVSGKVNDMSKNNNGIIKIDLWLSTMIEKLQDEKTDKLDQMWLDVTKWIDTIKKGIINLSSKLQK